MKVLLADDHNLIRENLREFMTRLDKFAQVFEAADLDGAVAVAAEHRNLDLVILDLMMPGMYGIAGVREMVVACPDTPIVVLSGSTRDDDVHGAMKLGARAFVPKSISGREMLDILRRVLDGETFVPEGILPDPEAAPAPPPAAVPEVEHEIFAQLTARERDVLDLLVQGQVNKQIARELGIEEITVKVHMQRLFKKLDVTNRTHAALKAVKLGWSDTPRPRPSARSGGAGRPAGGERREAAL